MMRRKRLFWQLLATYSMSCLFILAVGYGLMIRTVTRWYERTLEKELSERLAMIVQMLSSVPDEGFVEASRTLAASSPGRITVVDPRGRVLAESQLDPAEMSYHGGRPEIAKALAGDVAKATRLSETTRRHTFYMAAPLFSQGRLRGAVRVAVPMDEAREALRKLYMKTASVALGALLLLGLLSFGLSSKVQEPVRKILALAQAAATGATRERIPPSGIAEIDDLGRAVQDLAAHLEERVRLMERQLNERDAILGSMVEGVFTVDQEGRILSMNEACGRLLGVSPQRVVGRSVEEGLRNSQLQAFVAKASSSDEPQVADLVLMGNPDQHVEAHGTPLRDSNGLRVGTLVVLHDVTKMKRLERIRRDFVANVSHELKTPVAAIQGAAETLREGALGDPQAASSFVDIIVRHASRMDAIMRDLMLLAQVEEQEAGPVALDEQALEPVIRTAVEVCAARASQKGVRIQITCPEGLKARINPSLLETALVNLLDNAVKYSEPGTTVNVVAERNGEVVISVKDQGCGIEARHLPRLFERFYRVDKARSRSTGGTGLGLAIVKHIAQAHGGRVSVESKVGLGSTFRIHLPTR